MQGDEPAIAAMAPPAPLSYTRMPGRWIPLARGAWCIQAIFALGLLVVNFSGYLAQLRAPCVPSSCEWQQLTPRQAATLSSIGWSVDVYAAICVALLLVTFAVCLAVSALIIWRRPDDRMAQLVALMLVIIGPTLITSSASTSSPWLVLDECATFLTTVLFVLVFSLFPTGQFVPRSMRWIVVGFLAIEVPFTFLPYGLFALHNQVFQLGWLVFLSELVALVLVQVYRYRWASSPLERQQTKWVVFGLTVPTMANVLISLLALLLPGAVEQNVLLLLAYNEASLFLAIYFPISLGIAMLRYRLWDIDALINNALVYGLLTGLLAALYAGLVFGLGRLAGLVTGQSDQPVALVFSTLVIFALFLPLRRRIQVAIDRRFYRHKYDAAKTLAGFSAALRNEVDLDQMYERLIAVVRETMEPVHISLWLRQPAWRSAESRYDGESPPHAAAGPGTDAAEHAKLHG